MMLEATVFAEELARFKESGLDNVLPKPLSIPDMQAITFAWMIKNGGKLTKHYFS